MPRPLPGRAVTLRVPVPVLVALAQVIQSEAAPGSDAPRVLDKSFVGFTATMVEQPRKSWGDRLAGVKLSPVP